jgi:hypothetical protein
VRQISASVSLDPVASAWTRRRHGPD